MSPTRRREVVHRTIVVNGNGNSRGYRNGGNIEKSDNKNGTINCYNGEGNGKTFSTVGAFQPTQPPPFDSKNSLTCRY